MSTDLRLVPPALVVWLAVALLLERPSSVAVTVAVAATVVAGAAWAAPARSWRATHALRTLSLCAACLAAVAASCAWRLAGVEASPLVSLAEQRRVVDAELQVVLDARTFTRFGDTSAVAGVRVLRVVVDGRAVRVSDRATAFLEGESADLVTGRRLVVRARLGPSEASDETATLDVLERTASRGAAWWWEGSESLRGSIRGSVSHTGVAESALVPALVAGDDAALPTELEEDFRRTGLTHLLAVSGTNLTIVLAVLLALARAARAPPRVLLVVGLLGVLGFVLLARPEPSVLRAAGMGLVGLAAVGYGGRKGLRALAVAIVVLLFLDPWLGTSVGFVLSVCATAGILVLAPPMAERLRTWLPHWVALAVAVPLAAQLACTPAIAAISDEVSLVAVAANLLAGPAVAPATVAGLFGGLLDLVWAPAGRVVGTAAGLSAGWIVQVARHSANLDGAAVPWAAPWWLLVPVVPLVAWALWRWAHRPVVVIGLVLGLGVALWRPPQPGWPPEGWVMVACDVGQGDATVVRTGPGEAIVVDAGEETAPVDRCLRGLRIDRVKALVLTHADADHVDGWPGVVEGRTVDVVLLGRRGVDVAGVPARMVGQGDRLRVGDVEAEVLWPEAADEQATQDERNGLSVVLRVETAGVTLLLSGDLGEAEQARLLAASPRVRADALKVAHHGSADTSERFVDAVAPRVATISVGADNDYGHPAPSAVEMLEAVGAGVWRTDESGDVAVVVQEGGLGVVTRGGGTGD
ncbi:DNA internalization-related competence protein ComEC/Rec2 [Aeromicrobium sp. CF4.19]|uniref:DNA internalization-related competence protein ComEC/Rec2 n=1 Tax=Aeromicrobium sp. CF4.19 TaxID=3373082 RepID=UPI003EE4CCD0